ncbi:4970_t:CDS:2, partial [Racocetra fulgida]
MAAVAKKPIAAKKGELTPNPLNIATKPLPKVALENVSESDCDEKPIEKS